MMPDVVFASQAIGTIVPQAVKLVTVTLMGHWSNCVMLKQVPVYVNQMSLETIVRNVELGHLVFFHPVNLVVNAMTHGLKKWIELAEKSII